VAVSAQVTVYAILPGRGYEQSVTMLGAEYDGFLIHDGWAPYYRFPLAFHQSCLAHLLKRCREMMQIASPAALAFPQGVEHLLQTSLELRDRYERGEVSERGMNIATGKLEAKLDRMLETPRRNPANRRLARHLEHEQLWLFTFLHCPGLDATNNTAERAIRGMVIARKVWGGNRTWEGARTQQILTSVLRTCWQREAVTCATDGDSGYCARRGLSRAALKLHARISDLLRTHVPPWRTGVDAPDCA
jgi:transposase